MTGGSFIHRVGVIFHSHDRLSGALHKFGKGFLDLDKFQRRATASQKTYEAGVKRLAALEEARSKKLAAYNAAAQKAAHRLAQLRMQHANAQEARDAKSLANTRALARAKKHLADVEAANLAQIDALQAKRTAATAAAVAKQTAHLAKLSRLNTERDEKLNDARLAREARVNRQLEALRKAHFAKLNVLTAQVVANEEAAQLSAVRLAKEANLQKAAAASALEKRRVAEHKAANAAIAANDKAFQKAHLAKTGAIAEQAAITQSIAAAARPGAITEKGLQTRIARTQAAIGAVEAARGANVTAGLGPKGGTATILTGRGVIKKARETAATIAHDNASISSLKKSLTADQAHLAQLQRLRALKMEIAAWDEKLNALTAEGVALSEQQGAINNRYAKLREQSVAKITALIERQAAAEEAGHQRIAAKLGNLINEEIALHTKRSKDVEVETEAEQRKQRIIERHHTRRTQMEMERRALEAKNDAAAIKALNARISLEKTRHAEELRNIESENQALAAKHIAEERRLRRRAAIERGRMSQHRYMMGEQKRLHGSWMSANATERAALDATNTKEKERLTLQQAQLRVAQALAGVGGAVRAGVATATTGVTSGAIGLATLGYVGHKLMGPRQEEERLDTLIRLAYPKSPQLMNKLIASAENADGKIPGTSLPFSTLEHKRMLYEGLSANLRPDELLRALPMKAKGRLAFKMASAAKGHAADEGVERDINTVIERFGAFTDPEIQMVIDTMVKSQTLGGRVTPKFMSQLAQRIAGPMAASGMSFAQIGPFAETLATLDPTGSRITTQYKQLLTTLKSGGAADRTRVMLTDAVRRGFFSTDSPLGTTPEQLEAHAKSKKRGKGRLKVVPSQISLRGLGNFDILDRLAAYLLQTSGMSPERYREVMSKTGKLASTEEKHRAQQVTARMGEFALSDAERKTFGRAGGKLYQKLATTRGTEVMDTIALSPKEMRMIAYTMERYRVSPGTNEVLKTQQKEQPYGLAYERVKVAGAQFTTQLARVLEGPMIKFLTDMTGWLKSLEAALKTEWGAWLAKSIFSLLGFVAGMKILNGLTLGLIPAIAKLGANFLLGTNAGGKFSIWLIKMAIDMGGLTAAVTRFSIALVGGEGLLAAIRTTALALGMGPLALGGTLLVLSATVVGVVGAIGMFSVAVLDLWGKLDAEGANKAKLADAARRAWEANPANRGIPFTGGAGQGVAHDTVHPWTGQNMTPPTIKKKQGDGGGGGGTDIHHKVSININTTGPITDAQKKEIVKAVEQQLAKSYNTNGRSTQAAGVSKYTRSGTA